MGEGTSDRTSDVEPSAITLFTFSGHFASDFAGQRTNRPFDLGKLHRGCVRPIKVFHKSHAPPPPHPGGTPNRLATENNFKCPFHGRGFYTSGSNFEGPAPRSLGRAAISLADAGQISIDKSQKYLFEKGGWDDPNSFLPFSA